MERAVFDTLFSVGFKKKREASEEEIAESQQKRDECEAVIYDRIVAGRSGKKGRFCYS